MGLDKWITPEEEKKNPKSKKERPPPKKQKDKIVPEKLKDLTKFILVCPKSKCNYKKTIVKRELKEKDMTCPKCKGKMKLKKS